MDSVIKRLVFGSLATVAALATISANALAQANPESPKLKLKDICFFNPETRAGIKHFSVVREIEELLRALHGDVFSKLTLEVCADGVDNNCDGQIDEGCSAEAPSKWGKTRECDLCMREQCFPEQRACEGNASCMDAMRCVVENSCMHTQFFYRDCVCNAQEDGPFCITRGPRSGPCGDKLIRPGVWDEWREPQMPNLLPLGCMTYLCSTECSENFRN